MRLAETMQIAEHANGQTNILGVSLYRAADMAFESARDRDVRLRSWRDEHASVARAFGKRAADLLHPRINESRLELPRADAKPVLFLEMPNLVVNNGKTLIQNRLYGITGPPVALSAMGVGTDNTAASVTQTQLNPTTSGSVFLQAFDATPTINAQTVTYTTTFGTGVANFSITEVGTFNGTTNGTSILYNRIVVSTTGIGKSSSFALALTLTSLQN